MGLMCYGGSWTYLGGFIAAVDIFGTAKVLEEGCNVFTTFVSEEVSSKDDDVTPVMIKESIRNMGLQFALMLSVAMSPTCAEFCVVIAIAYKASCLIPVKEHLKKFSYTDIIISEDEDWLDFVEDGWLDILAFLASFILWIVFYGLFPHFVITMYMVSFGLSMMLEVSKQHFIIDLGLQFIALPKVDIIEVVSRKYVKWGLVALLSMWQAWYDYGGITQFMSWLIFVLPAVQLYKILC